jgi:hypothetical protein
LNVGIQSCTRHISGQSAKVIDSQGFQARQTGHSAKYRDESCTSLDLMSKRWKNKLHENAICLVCGWDPIKKYSNFQTQIPNSKMIDFLIFFRCAVLIETGNIYLQFYLCSCWQLCVQKGQQLPKYVLYKYWITLKKSMRFLKNLDEK